MCGCKGKCGCNIISTTKGEKGDASPVIALGYKSYVANWQQDGTAVPIFYVLSNTIGTVAVSRLSAGVYKLTSSGLFTLNKTWISCFADYGDIGNTYLPLGNNIGGRLLGYYNVSFSASDPNTITINVVDTTFANADLSTIVGGKTIISLPEIRVYL